MKEIKKSIYTTYTAQRTEKRLIGEQIASWSHKLKNQRGYVNR
jgi:hypothetical protein